MVQHITNVHANGIKYIDVDGVERETQGRQEGGREGVWRPLEQLSTQESVRAAPVEVGAASGGS